MIVVLLAVPQAPVSHSFHLAVLCAVFTFHSDLQASRCKSIKFPAGSVSWLRICCACLCRCRCFVSVLVSRSVVICLRVVIDVTRLLFLLLLIA